VAPSPPTSRRHDVALWRLTTSSGWRKRTWARCERRWCCSAEALSVAFSCSDLEHSTSFLGLRYRVSIGIFAVMWPFQVRGATSLRVPLVGAFSCFCLWQKSKANQRAWLSFKAVDGEFPST
jgi:hypothetical protein